MSNELALAYTTGATLKALVWGKDRTTRWNGSAMAAPSTIADADWATGMVAMTEQDSSDATGSGQYVGSLPATGVTQELQIDFLVGATPTVGQRRIGYQSVGAVNSYASEKVSTLDLTDTEQETIQGIASGGIR